MKSIINKVLPKAIGCSLNSMSFFSQKKAGELALQIFCKPRMGRIRPKDDDFLTTSAFTQVVKHRQGEVKAYGWNPSGKEVVLLLHGWESNAARWRFLIPQLIQANFQVIAIDAPAHGASSGDLFDIIKYCDALKATDELFKPDYVVGHSLGGATLSFYFKNYGNTLFKKIVLLGVPSELDSMISNYKEILGLSDRMMNVLENTFYQKFEMEITDISVVDFCKTIESPVLLIHDHDDTMVSVEDSILYDKTLKESEILFTNGLGHGLQDEKVYNKILNYLSSSS